MAYLFFQCSSCLNNLAVDSYYARRVIECPGCSEKLSVPDAKCSFKCKQCHTELHAPAGMAGSVVDCPECETTAKVPPPPKMTSGIPRKNTVTDTLSSSTNEDNDFSGKKITCPKCHFLIPVSDFQFLLSLREYSPYACPKCGEGVVSSSFIVLSRETSAKSTYYRFQ